MIKLLVLSRFTNAGQPQEGGSPALLWMSGHRLRSVRSAPPLGAVRVHAEPSLQLTKRGEGRTAYGTERSGRSASERMFAECAEPKRSEVEKPWCRSRATSDEAVRSALMCSAVRV